MYTILILLILTTLSLNAQSWVADNIWHVAFKYNEVSPFDFEESSHWTPDNVSFWTDEKYDVGSLHSANLFSAFKVGEESVLSSSSLILRDQLGLSGLSDRVTLDHDGLQVIGGGSWGTIDLHTAAHGGGQLDLYTGGNGNYTARLGKLNGAVNRGGLYLYASNGSVGLLSGVGLQSYGYSYHYGQNGSPNVYIGTTYERYNAGRIIIYDGNTQQAGMYINGAGQGVVWGDIKNFRMDHPDDQNKEIWYASLEGPEAGAYDRGTARLVNGEAFIPYSEHYQMVANSTTATVSLTSHEWDTYGLAVVEKNEKGFKVKELKGGTGNFSFDWEVKSVRNGYENFEPIRDRLEASEDQEFSDAQSKSGRLAEQVQPQPKTATIRSQGHEGCAAHKH